TCARDTHTIGGTVSGLLGTGLVLQINGGDELAISGNGPFTFPVALASGALYSITIASDPANPQQSCTISNASGAIGDTDVTQIAVSCSTVGHRVGGRVRGLAGSALVLTLNGG